MEVESKLIGLWQEVSSLFWLEKKRMRGACTKKGRGPFCISNPMPIEIMFYKISFEISSLASLAIVASNSLCAPLRNGESGGYEQCE